MPSETELKTELDEKFAALPFELRQTVAVVPISELIYEIGKKHTLGIDKIGFLGHIVSEFILGYIEPAEFVSEIERRLNKDAETSKTISQEMNAKVFRPIREGLRVTLGRKAVIPPQPRPLQTPPPQPRVAPPQPPAPPVARPAPPPPPPPSPEAVAGKSKEAPIIRPPGVMPTEADRGERLAARVERPVIEEIKPSVPSKLESIRVAPPPPTPLKPPPTAPSQPTLPPPPAPPPPVQPSAPPVIKPPVITKAELERELERFRKPAEAPGTRDQALDKEIKPQSIKLPPQKIPKPPAPEKYTVDPYREPPE